MNVPFKLLVRPHTRPMLHLPQTAPHVVAFRMPDGDLLYSTPAASELDAVHNLFEAKAGRPLAMPYWEHMAPLANAALWLGAAFQGLIVNEVELHRLLAQYKPQEGDLDEQIFRTVHETLSSLQATVAAANEVSICLEDIRADKHAATMRAHPLTEYAGSTALRVMNGCTLTVDALGLPGAITKDGENFAVNFGHSLQSETVSRRWVDDHAHLWRDNRDAYLQHYQKCRDAELAAVDEATLH